MKKEEETFAIRTYDKAELASLYCPGREPGAALQNLYRWIRRIPRLTEELKCHRLQQIPPLLPETGGGNHCEIPGRALTEKRAAKEKQHKNALKCFRKTLPSFRKRLLCLGKRP